MILKELREAAIVGGWIIPIAVLANALGFAFLIAFEESRHAAIGFIGYFAIPMVLGFLVLTAALRRRPRASSLWVAVAIRPLALYLFLALTGAWLYWGSGSPGFGLVSPIAIAPVAATVTGLCAVVWRARPSRAT